MNELKVVQNRVVILLSVIGVLFIFFKSLQWIWTGNKLKRVKFRFLPLEYFVVLVFTYIIILIGFGFIYAVMIFVGIPTLIEAGQIVMGTFQHLIATGIYFSTITLFSVGYGDIVPIGIGRWVAIVEAFIGYILPVAFVMRSFLVIEDSYFNRSKSY